MPPLQGEVVRERANRRGCLASPVRGGAELSEPEGLSPPPAQNHRGDREKQQEAEARVATTTAAALRIR